MTKSKLAGFRKVAKMTQQQLADAIGAHWTTISRLETGKLELDYEWAEKLAPVFSISPFDLLDSPGPHQKVFLKGSFGMGGRQMKVFENDGRNAVRLPWLNPGGWWCIDDDSFYPQFKQGDLIHMEAREPGQMEVYLGQLAFVVEEGDSARVFFGTLARGKKRDTFCVRRTNLPDSDDFKAMVFTWVDAAHFYFLPEGDDAFDPAVVPGSEEII